MKPEITLAALDALDLRVGTVISAENVPDTDKLMVLQVDFGTEKRQIVTNIRQYISAETLTARQMQIVCILNLPPRKMKGLISEGMLMGAHSGESFTLLTTDQNIVPGATV